MGRLAGANHLFTKRDHRDILVLIVAKTTDDFLIAGYKVDIEKLFILMRDRFVVGKATIERRMKFNGCIIYIGEDGGVSLSIHDYRDRLAPIEISINRRK